MTPDEASQRARVKASIERRNALMSFGEHAAGVLAVAGSGLFVVDPEDSFVSMNLLNNGGYNDAEIERLTALVSKTSNVLVVGAHIGAHTVPLSRACRHLIAIEANPRAFDYLQANLRLNGCSNVVTHNVAASNRVERIEFLVSSDNSGGSKRMPVVVDPAYVYDNPNVVEMGTVVLDALIEERSFDLVLMDIEGSEYFALQGMQEILAGTEVLSVEFVHHHLKNVAGIGPDEFLEPILPHFDWMCVVEDKAVFSLRDIPGKIRQMYDDHRHLDGIFFSKHPPSPWLLNGRVPAAPNGKVPWTYFRRTPLANGAAELSVREFCDLARDFLSVEDKVGARNCYHTVIRLTDPPDTPEKRVARGEACQFMALEAHERSDDGTAADWWHKALSADPLDIDCRLDFINKGLLPLHWTEVARTEADRAARIAPHDPRVWQVAANIERESNDRRAMESLVDKALAAGPDNAGSHLVAAQCRADVGRFEEAKQHYYRAMELGSHRLADAKHGLGIVLFREGRVAEAIPLLDEALELSTGDKALVRWNRSEMLLAEGRYAEGWADHSIRFDNQYRGRELASFGRLGRRFKAPLWTRDAAPCRVHVHPEMGYGDVICLSRYLPLLREMGHDVRFEVDPRMVDLFRPGFPDIKVVPMATDYPGALGLEEFDRHITTMSFPHLFGTTLDAIPWRGPYIKADPERVARIRWAPFFAGKKTRRRVGLCWGAGVRPGLWYTEYGRRKSMHFDDLDPLWAADVDFFSLQVGPEAADNRIIPGLQDAATAWAAGPSWTSSKLDWADSAAAIELLDLVITIDTAVAHLAAAMGKPVWLMMHTGLSWHWMTPQAWGGRCETESPWYPSVRIFRQQKPHEWGGVVERVTKELLK